MIAGESQAVHTPSYQPSTTGCDLHTTCWGMCCVLPCWTELSTRKCIGSALKARLTHIQEAAMIRSMLWCGNVHVSALVAAAVPGCMDQPYPAPSPRGGAIAGSTAMPPITQAMRSHLKALAEELLARWRWDLGVEAWQETCGAPHPAQRSCSARARRIA